MGEWDKAISDYAEIIRLEPKSGFGYYARGTVYEKKGEKANSEADYARARELGYKP